LGFALRGCKHPRSPAFGFFRLRRFFSASPFFFGFAGFFVFAGFFGFAGFSALPVLFFDLGFAWGVKSIHFVVSCGQIAKRVV